MRILLFLPVGATPVIATACGQVVAALNPIEVLAADVQQRGVPLYRRWIGCVDGFVNTKIEAQAR
jgi:hypothetical protein